MAARYRAKEVLKKFFIGPEHAMTNETCDGAGGGGRNCRIGPWTFDGESNELIHDTGKTRRLEDRASRALALLARRRGETVARRNLIEAVWNGRSLSDNSLAVVISDLRKALGDNPKDAKYIETVPKRGYRLNGCADNARSARAARSPGGAANRSLGPWVGAVAAVLACAVLASAWVFARPQAGPPVTIVTVNNVQNQTGLPEYDALAASITELGASHLAAAPVEALLVRDRWDFDAEDPSRGLYEDFGENARVLHITTRIVMDDDTPTVTMFANNPRTNEVLWTTTFASPDGPLGPVLEAQLDRFIAELSL